MKKIILMLNIIFCLAIIGNIQVVFGESYYLVKVNKDGSRQNLNKMTNNLSNAIDEMNKLATDINSMPSVAEGSVNGKLVSTKYGLVKIAGYQYLYSDQHTSSIRTYVNTNGNRDYDGAFLGSLQNGRINVKISGFSGWVTEHLSNVAESNYSEIIPLSRVTSPSFYTVSGGEIKHHYTRDLTAPGVDNGIYSVNTLGKAPVGLSNGRYYSYDGIYFYTDLIKLLDDYKNGNYNNAANKDKPYYNYYQYVPFRTRSNITASDLDKYLRSKNLSGSVIEGKGSSFVSSGNKHTVNPAYLYSVAVHESGHGTSAIAKNKNNIFGIKVYDSSTGSGTVYNSIEACIEEAAKYIFSLGYADAVGDSRYYGAFLGNKESGMNVKYASDPYWGEIIAARYYAIDKSAGFKDYNKETLGIKMSKDAVNVRKDKTTSSAVVYKMMNNRAGISAKNMPVTIVEQVEGQNVSGSTIWYKIRSDTILDKNKNIIDLFKEINALYNYNDPYLYVHSSNITKVNQGLNCTHSYGNWNILKEANCLEDGQRERSCNICSFKQTETIQKLGHNLSQMQIIKEATCEENGYKEASCTRCLEKKREDIVKLGHTYKDWIINKEPTDDEDGEKQSKCERCGVVTKIVLPSLSKYIEKPGLHHLEKFEYNNKSARLEMQGFLAIKEIDNKKEKEYSIEFVDDKTGEKTVMKLNPQHDNWPFEVPSENNKSLKYSWYNASIDLSVLKQGNYKAYIVAKQDTYMTRQPLSNFFSKKITKKGIQGERGYVFTTNYYHKEVPIEINVRDEGLISHKEPPSNVSMFNTTYKIDFKDNNIKIMGTSFNVGASYSKTDEVNREFIFENIDTYERYKFNASYIENGPYKITLAVPDGMDKTRAWFDESIDISKLPKGTYCIHIRTYNNKVDDSSELNDIFMTDLSAKKITLDGKEYSLSINKNRKYRIELTIK